MLRTVITAPAEECFRLSLSAQAHARSMSGSGERAASSGPDQLGLGDQLTLEARHFGWRFRMSAVITSYEPPTRFVDEQRHGPFAAWWHEHRFEPHPAGTVMTDRVRYRLPWGPLGTAADKVAVRRHLVRIITTRNAYLAAQLERPG